VDTWTVLRPALLLVATAALTFLLGLLGERAVRPLTARHPDAPLWPLLRRCRVPFWVTLASLLLLTGLPGARLAPAASGFVRHLLVLVLIAAAAWLLSRLVALLIGSSVNRYAAQRRDPARLRRVRTQTGMLRRVAQAVIAVLALASMLLTFPAVRTVGTSLLASAGLIAAVTGVAAQSTLGNLFAGIQMAFGDMARIGDVVVVNGEWGTVEELTLTYVVIATWDERRIVTPVSKFTSQPFENWSRRTPEMTGAVLFHLDHSVPMDDLRDEFDRVLKESPLWDGRSRSLVVLDTTPSTVVVRAVVTAKNSDDIFGLRCLVRERLIDFLRREHPYALPRVATAPAAGAPPTRVVTDAEAERVSPQIPHPRAGQASHDRVENAAPPEADHGWQHHP